MRPQGVTTNSLNCTNFHAMRYTVFIAFLFFNTLHSYSQTCSDLNKTFTGEGTYYDYSGGGNCGYPFTDSLAAAINASQYDNSLTCGACVEVTGERGTIQLRIEDQCPECSFGDLDLSEKAFPLIADPVKGRVPISWHIIECPVKGNIHFYFTGNASPEYYIQIQIRNSKYAVSKLEFKRNGVYEDIAKASYNFFIADKGLGRDSTFDFRITDLFGNVMEEKGVVFKADEAISGTEQFPSCNTTAQAKFEDISKLLVVDQEHGSTRIVNSSNRDFYFSVNTILGQELFSGNISAKNSVSFAEKADGLIILKIWNDHFLFTKKIIKL